MMVTNTALLAGTYRGRDQGVAFGVWTSVTAVSAATGPLLGGVLTEALGWRSIFLVNLPMALVALWTGRRWLPEGRDPAGGRIDVPGTALFVLAATLVTFALIRAGEDGWGSPSVVPCLAAAAGALIAFGLVERHRRHPMLDLALLRKPAFVALLLGALVFNAASVADFVYRSLWLQSIVHLDSFAAGLALTPMGAAALVTAMITGRLAATVEPRLPIGIGLLLISAGGFSYLLLLTPDASWPALLPGLLITGAGVGVCSPVLASAVLATVPRAGRAWPAAR